MKVTLFVEKFAENPKNQSALLDHLAWRQALRSTVECVLSSQLYAPGSLGLRRHTARKGTEGDRTAKTHSWGSSLPRGTTSSSTGASCQGSALSGAATRVPLSCSFCSQNQQRLLPHLRGRNIFLDHGKNIRIILGPSGVGSLVRVKAGW